MDKTSYRVLTLAVSCMLFLSIIAERAVAWPCSPPGPEGCGDCYTCTSTGCEPYGDCWGGCPSCESCVNCYCQCNAECGCGGRTCPACKSCVGCNCELNGTCLKCSGYQPWSGADPDAGTPPDCNPHVSSRTLGSCVPSSNPEDTCTESSQATEHIITYFLEGPTIEEEGICAVLLALCLRYAENEYDEIQCAIEYANCINSYSDCLIAENSYYNYQTGCR